MIAVYLVYGAAFVLMGLAVAVYPKVDSKLWLTPNLWALAGFGLLHGVNEWLDMLVLAGVIGRSQLAPVGVALLVASFALLAWFGASTLSHRYRALRLLPMLLLLAWGIGGAVFGFRGTPTLIIARYSLGLPGALLAGAAMWLSASHPVDPAWPPGLRRAVKSGAVGLAAYGLATGLIVPTGTFLPASVLNEVWFFDALGFPIQLLRAGCAVVITVSVLGTLRLLRWESNSARERLLAELAEHRDNLHALAEQRAAELVEARQTLDSLGRLLPVCAWCKKIRNDDGYWKQLEVFMNDEAQIEVTHSICPDCADESFGQVGKRPRLNS